MKKIVAISIFFLVTVGSNSSFTQNKSIKTKTIAESVLNKGLKTLDLTLYPGSLLMASMSELTVNSKDPQTLNKTIALFEDFKTQKIKGKGSLISYEAGGSGVAYLNYLKKTSNFSEHVLAYADNMFKNQKRTNDNIMTAPWLKDSPDQVMIDCAFAVTPYLLYAGLAHNKPEYVDYAVFDCLELFKVLKDSNGLIHQARGFQGTGSITQDNWSRGNGWGSFALAFLVRDLPETHPRKKEVNELAKIYFENVLKFQNEEGLWHQEMTDKKSFIETSGSGLMLFAIGVCLEKKVLDKSFLPKFIKGIQGYTSYIAADGSVGNACGPCLSPGKGTKKDYAKKFPEYNDPHAFGPAVLAFSQAIKLGIKEINPLKSMDCMAKNPLTPRAYIHYMPEANGNICWENDRIAFRVYGSPVKDRVSSGIDVWTKSVAYPIIDKWYRLNAEGKEYHEDRGEGCDFFHVGFTRGNGGTAIWNNDKPYISQTYSSHKILKNTDEEVAFEVNFDAWDAGGKKVSEKKVISMKMGTNFFKVTSTFTTDSKEPLTAAIGIAYVNNPEIITDKAKGSMTVWESYLPKNGELGTTVLVKSADIQDFKNYEKQQFVLVKVKSGEPIHYKVGAGWTKSPQFKTKQEWLDYVNKSPLTPEGELNFDKY